MTMPNIWRNKRWDDDYQPPDEAAMEESILKAFEACARGPLIDEAVIARQIMDTPVDPSLYLPTQAPLTVRGIEVGFDKGVRSSYLHDAIEPQKRSTTIRRIIARLQPIADQFDTIAFRGMSGALIAPSVADAMGKQIIVVRKIGECQHSGFRVEGIISKTRYVIVDDFVFTGGTVQAIVDGIQAGDMAANWIPLLVVEYTRITTEAKARRPMNLVDNEGHLLLEIDTTGVVESD